MSSARHRPWTVLAFLIALDVVFAFAIARLPSRLILPPRPDLAPNASPSFAAVMPGQVVFIATAPRGSGDTVLTRVPLRDGDQPAVSRRIGRDFAILEPARGLDAVMLSGPRWGWNGRTLLVAAASRSFGTHRVHVSLIGADGLVLPTREIDATRPAAGWAGDHFEVAYVTPAPPPDSGRVQWVIDVDEHGAVSNERIVSPAGTSPAPLAWPRGVRTRIEGAQAGAVILPDGSSVPVPHTRTSRARPWFVLGADGSVQVRFTQPETISGSEVAGDYTLRVASEGTTVEAHLGSRVERPRYVVSRQGNRVAFETDIEARAVDLLAVERDGVLHLIDPRGFHVRLRASDLTPLGPRVSRTSYLAGALGTATFVLVALALALAHALAFIADRAARSSGSLRRFASISGLIALFAAGFAVWMVWQAGG